MPPSCGCVDPQTRLPRRLTKWHPMSLHDVELRKDTPKRTQHTHTQHAHSPPASVCITVHAPVPPSGFPEAHAPNCDAGAPSCHTLVDKLSTIFRPSLRHNAEHVSFLARHMARRGHTRTTDAPVHAVVGATLTSSKLVLLNR